MTARPRSRGHGSANDACILHRGSVDHREPYGVRSLLLRQTRCPRSALVSIREHAVGRRLYRGNRWSAGDATQIPGIALPAILRTALDRFLIVSMLK